MKKLNLSVTLILAVSLIITFSFAGIASKAPEVKDSKQVRQFAANPIEQVNLKEDKTQAKLVAPSPPGLKKIGKDGFVTVNALNVRNLGSMKGKVISSINKGRRIYVFGEKNGWYYVEYAKGKEGWVYSKYVEFRANPLPQEPELKKIEKNGYVTAARLNVRNLGSIKGKIISSLRKDTKIYVYGEKYDWYYVEYAKGKKGWVSGNFIMFKDIDPVKDLGLRRIEKLGTATVNNLNVRDLGSMKGKILISIDKGESLYVFGEKNGWYYVQFFEDAYGWVYGKYMIFK